MLTAMKCLVLSVFKWGEVTPKISHRGFAHILRVAPEASGGWTPISPRGLAPGKLWISGS